MFENYRKSLIQHCEAKRATFTFGVDKSSLKMPKIVNFGEVFFLILKLDMTVLIEQKWGKMQRLKNSNATFFSDFQIMWYIRKFTSNFFFTDKTHFCELSQSSPKSGPINESFLDLLSKIESNLSTSQITPWFISSAFREPSQPSPSSEARIEQAHLSEAKWLWTSRQF